MLVQRLGSDYSDYDGYNGLPWEGPHMTTDAWTVAEAKAKLSEVIARAQSDGPQIITKNGRRTVVVVAAAEWERKTRRTGNLADFFATSPLKGSGLEAERVRDHSRKVGL